MTTVHHTTLASLQSGFCIASLPDTSALELVLTTSSSVRSLPFFLLPRALSLPLFLASSSFLLFYLIFIYAYRMAYLSLSLSVEVLLISRSQFRRSYMYFSVLSTFTSAEKSFCSPTGSDFADCVLRKQGPLPAHEKNAPCA